MSSLTKCIYILLFPFLFGSSFAAACVPAGDPQVDTDGDGICDASDNAPTIPNTNQLDSDGDGRGDVADNCPAVANANQLDTDGNGVGDACEPPPVNLTIDATGSGSGAIVVEGSSGKTCIRASGSTTGICAMNLGNGAQITLTTVAFPGTILTWGGACAGTTGATCTLTMDAAKSVTADFSPPPTATTSVIVDPDTPATLYVGLDGAGVYVSTNSAGSWSPATAQPTNLAVKALARRSGTPLYAGTYGGGVFKTGVGDTVFAACDTQPDNANVLTLLLDAAGKLYAGTEAGVFVSNDQCATWSAANSGLPN